MKSPTPPCSTGRRFLFAATVITGAAWLAGCDGDASHASGQPAAPVVQPGTATPAVGVVSPVGSAVNAAPAVAAPVAAPAVAPPADYNSVTEAHAAGRAGLGRSLLVRLRRYETEPTQFSGQSCDDTDGAASFNVTFGPEQHDLVRAVTSRLVDECQRVHVQITRPRQGFRPMETRLLAVLDAAPVPATPAPAGADFGAMDDIALAGSRARGRLVQLPMRRGDVTENTFLGLPCGPHGGGSMDISVAPDRRAAMMTVPADIIGPCRVVTVRLVELPRMATSWRAELIDVGGEFNAD